MAKILVVDDNEGVLETLESVLKSGGHEVVLAEKAKDGIQAWTAARDAGAPFALIITDLQMPHGHEGIEMLQAIKKEAGGALPPAILHTATVEQDSSVLRRLQEAGLPEVKLVRKGMGRETLLALVKGMIAVPQSSTPLPQVQDVRTGETAPVPDR